MAKKKLVDELEVGGELDWAKMAKSFGGELLDEIDPVKSYIDTGLLALNFVCSGKFIGGGIPSGKIIEIFGDSASGKSLVGTNILKGTQSAGGVAVLLDAERAVSKEFAVMASKIDPRRIIVIEASTLESAFARIYNLIKKVREDWKVPMDKPIVIIYDSIAASPSEREFAETTIDMETASKAAIKEAGAGSDKPGERAKICSKELRKLPSILGENNASVVFINQIRQKIGVLFGCFSGHSKVMLADGSWMKIGKIVNQKLPLDVLSLNMTTGKVESKKITGWHKNGVLKDDEKFFKIKFKRNFDLKSGTMCCTPNHQIIKQKGGLFEEISAGDLRVGDEISAVQPYFLNQDQMQVVYGSVLGDGSIRGRDYGNCELRIGHGIRQEGYCLWKRELLSNVSGKFSYDRENSKCGFSTSPLYELASLASYKIGKGNNRSCIIPQEIADNLNELGLAIWYMDDGTYGGYHNKWGSGKATICCKKFVNREIMMPFFNRMGLNPTIKTVGYVFNAEDTEKLHQIIARFIPECMGYKLHDKFKHLFGFNMLPAKEVEYRTITSKIESIDRNWINPTNSRMKFDLTIEDNSTYVVGGAFVHNSDETTAGGGKALEYYASLRLRLRSNKVPKDAKGNVMGVNVNVQNVKNRCFRPFVEAKSMHLLFEQGINPFGGLLELMIQYNRVKAGSPGNYLVMEPYAGGREIKFKSNRERNDVPLDVLLECPALLDAKSEEEVMYYANLYQSAIDAVENDIAEEEDASHFEG